MSDKATLRRLLREHSEANTTTERVAIEDRTLKLFDTVQDEAYTTLNTLREAYEVLRSIEWILDEDIGGYYCPVCNQWKADGHRKGCKLAAVLNEPEIG